MARLHRIDVPGVAQHVIVRGVDRQPCSFGDADRETYLAALRSSAASSDCAVHAFVLMSNHVHLLGDARFQERIAAMVSRRTHVAPLGRPRRIDGKWT
jgi:putative transposase